MEPSEYNKIFYTHIFDKKSLGYYQSQKRKIEIVLNFFEKHRNGKILDIGCGDGFISSLIKDITKAEVYGVDISRSSVEKARKKGIKAKVVNIDKKFPFRSNTFDAVFCGDIVEHIYDSEALLMKIYNILKPEGYLIVSVPNIAAWYNRFFLLVGLMPIWVESSLKRYTGNPFIKEGVGHIHAFTERSLKELLQLTGFKIESVKGSPILGDGSFPLWIEKVWNFTDSIFAKKPSLSSVVVVKARKAKNNK